MKKSLLMGNEAIALGAIRAGVRVVTGYPGTPSTEILETIARKNTGDIYVEWSVNEKSALEVAAGAAYAGVRSLVTMKQVGLNVASDPLMSLAYIGVEGGMVVVVADDPGPISSQTEQDTRHFAIFAKLPVFDPSSPEEAYAMIGDAFAYSEKYKTPVLFRPTTRVCHGSASIDLDNHDDRNDDTNDDHKNSEWAPGNFVKNPKWTIFPKLSYEKHLAIEARRPVLEEDFSSYRFNLLAGSGKMGIAAGGISYTYTKEVLGTDLKDINAEGKETTAKNDYRLLKVATPNPFPIQLAMDFLSGLEEVLVLEELDPVIEKELIFLCGKYHLPVKIYGKLSGHMPHAGENSVEIARAAIGEFLGSSSLLPDVTLDESHVQRKKSNDNNDDNNQMVVSDMPVLPVRPPVLCAGCPHRASFYAVKQAMKGKKAVFSGDIGCYTLGNAKPLDMVDTCLCMGAGITIAQGLHRAEPDTTNFAFIGDSTFFHTGIPGVINAVYNETDIVLIILDNATTAMTGHQPHPGIGKTMMGNISEKISIPGVLEALGVKRIFVSDPLDITSAIATVKQAAAVQGVSAIVFESPCIANFKPIRSYAVDAEKCTGCKRCIRELGCPAISMADGKAQIDLSLCYGCSLCTQICTLKAIGGRQA